MEKHRPVNILLVDDKPENLLALEAILEPLGHNLVRAHSGTEALKHLLTDDFALILLDVQMPVIDGFETAALIKHREKCRYIPIVFVTAISKEIKYQYQGYTTGAVDYITKPFQPEILKSKVAVFVELYLKTEQIKEQAEVLRLNEQREAQRQLAEREYELDRRQMEALSASESRLRHFKATLDATIDSVFIFDPISLNYTYANHGALKHLGLGYADVMALSPVDLIPDVDETEFRRMIEPLIAGSVPALIFETIHQRSDSTPVPVEVSLQHVAPEGSDARFVSIVRDITERKQAEAALAEVYAREHRIAETLQRSLLLAPAVDQYSGLHVAPFYEAALDEASLGGDFFDVFAVGDTHVALVVGDVTGKGLQAAARTAEVKYALRAFVWETRNPSDALAKLNSFILDGQPSESGGTESFICLALAIIETATGDALIACAGVEPPAILRVAGGAEAVELSGLPIGIIPDTSYFCLPAHLEIGDSILMTTDGITEARSGPELFGYDRFLKCAQNAAKSETVDCIGQIVLDVARKFAGGKLQDDACLLIARRTPLQSD